MDHAGRQRDREDLGKDLDALSEEVSWIHFHLDAIEEVASLRRLIHRLLQEFDNYDLQGQQAFITNELATKYLQDHSSVVAFPADLSVKTHHMADNSKEFAYSVNLLAINTA